MYNMQILFLKDAQIQKNFKCYYMFKINLNFNIIFINYLSCILVLVLPNINRQ